MSGAGEPIPCSVGAANVSNNVRATANSRQGRQVSNPGPDTTPVKFGMGHRWQSGKTDNPFHQLGVYVFTGTSETDQRIARIADVLDRANMQLEHELNAPRHAQLVRLRISLQKALAALEEAKFMDETSDSVG